MAWPFNCSWSCGGDACGSSVCGETPSANHRDQFLADTLNSRGQDGKLLTPKFLQAGMDESVGTQLADGSSRCSKEREKTKKIDPFLVDMSPSGFLGSGSSSVCRRAMTCQTGEAVAVKLYRREEEFGNGVLTIEDVEMQFQRQVAVLEQLQQPPKAPQNPRLFHPRLQELSSSSFFIRVVDCSRTDAGEPGADREGNLWVATELAQYSLRQFLDMRKQQGRPLQREEVWSMAKHIILVVAALHARGLVHVDLKPENLMVFENRQLKLIDVDGCVRAGSSVSISVTPISFSAYYCAPEWADLLVNCWQRADDGTVTIDSSLDVWSVGMILCELVSLEAVMDDSYQKITANAFTQRQAALLYMEWLSGIDTLAIPAEVKRFDAPFAKLISEELLQCSAEKRWTLAECLAHASLADAPDLAWLPLSLPPVEKLPSATVASARASIKLDKTEFAAIRRFSVQRHSCINVDSGAPVSLEYTAA